MENDCRMNAERGHNNRKPFTLTAILDGHSAGLYPYNLGQAGLAKLYLHACNRSWRFDDLSRADTAVRLIRD